MRHIQIWSFFSISRCAVTCDFICCCYVQVLAIDCLVPDVAFTQKFAAILLLPLCVAILITVVAVGTATYKRYIVGRTWKNSWNHLNLSVASLSVLLYFFYLFASRTILDVFNCAPTEPSDGKLYLQVVRAIAHRLCLHRVSTLLMVPTAADGCVCYNSVSCAGVRGVRYRRWHSGDSAALGSIGSYCLQCRVPRCAWRHYLAQSRIGHGGPTSPGKR
jgi:hypothetical protein